MDKARVKALLAYPTLLAVLMSFSFFAALDSNSVQIVELRKIIGFLTLFILVSLVIGLALGRSVIYGMHITMNIILYCATGIFFGISIGLGASNMGIFVLFVFASLIIGNLAGMIIGIKLDT